jgi:hypothetical protein
LFAASEPATPSIEPLLLWDTTILQVAYEESRAASLNRKSIKGARFVKVFFICIQKRIMK